VTTFKKTETKIQGGVNSTSRTRSGAKGEDRLKEENPLLKQLLSPKGNLKWSRGSVNQSKEKGDYSTGEPALWQVSGRRKVEKDHWKRDQAIVDR